MQRCGGVDESALVVLTGVLLGGCAHYAAAPLDLTLPLMSETEPAQITADLSAAAAARISLDEVAARAVRRNPPPQICR